ncbi:CsbD family protein [Priestia taiwanensis]|uniref:CsbD-like domain-containing protein n=1 Tax=Priestia taiwanensis TaxID=1347902 RepID=A0A917AWM3_9BACI|nr:CsbD family protein [Priestia taiwanensis]MBM7363545.1 uncharacterized protein YjbJ (UPF0337 family) [Priestia taiwanensis]GGE76244.1 hypothetical protein GCM10007140_27460 [Priestia taiwanensis]
MHKDIGTNNFMDKVDQVADQMADTFERIKNDDKVQGIAEQVKGKAKEVVGQLTSDSSTELEGKWQQVKGAVQEKIGEAKDLFKQPPTQ